MQMVAAKSRLPLSIMNASFWVGETAKLIGLGVVAYLCGCLVRDRNVRVNYTRKVNFFAMFFVPKFVDTMLPHGTSATDTILRNTFFLVSLGCFAQPVRVRLPPAATMFLSYDRPEDRPHTLWWLTTQLVAGALVLLALSYEFKLHGISNSIFIPILIHGIGDGLAEPIGVRFGRHKYRVWALGSRRKYTRSLEGSAWVLVVGIIVVALFRASFTQPQFAMALLTVPPLMALAEASSPHTWDTPLMFLVGGCVLLAITTFV